MTMSPLNVRMVSVALPSPKVARMSCALLSAARPGSRAVAASPPIVSGKSDRIEPLKLFAFSSKPAGLRERQAHGRRNAN